MTISELIGRRITPVGKDKKEGEEIRLTCPIPVVGELAQPLEFEVSVFNHLFLKKEELGIESVIRFKNRVVDGAILFSDHRKFMLEIKLRMNWLKACQAEWQFRQFLKGSGEAERNGIHGAIVVTEEFSGDWSRKANKAKNLWGWEGWYFAPHDNIDGKPLYLLMFSNGKLLGYPE